MLRGWLYGVLALAACAFLPAGAQQPDRPPAAAFGRLPAVDSASLSPDGRLLAVLQGQPESKLIVYNLDTSQVVRTLGAGTQKVRSIEWGDNEHVLATISATMVDANDPQGRSYEWQRILSLNISTGKSAYLRPGVDERINISHSIWGHFPGSHGVVLMNALSFFDAKYKMPTGSHMKNDTPFADALVLELNRVDSASGRSTVLASGARFTVDWLLGADGAVLARADMDTKQKVFAIYARSGSGWKQILSIENRNTPPIRFGGLHPADGTPLVIDARGDKSLLARLDLTSGALTPVAVPGYDGPVFDVLLDSYSAKGVAIFAGSGPRVWLDPAMAAMEAKIQRALPKMHVAIEDWSEDRNRILVSGESPSTPTTYYLLDNTKKTLDTVGETYPELEGAQLGEKVQVTYAARDGERIPAFVTWPPGAARKNLPMVVLPHGGPESMDDSGFDWLAQFIATRGYVVLQPQFRGSAGFTRAWADAGRRQWGGVMQNDLTDGVRHLVRAGSVDPKRVCIVGASYGGYAALAGATLTPELYACAVSISGISDLPVMLRWIKARQADQGNPGRLNYWLDHIGAAGDPTVMKASPINNVSAVRAPILLLHGRDDTVVPYAQSAQMAEALTRAGKSVTLTPLVGEDHWLSLSQTRTQTLEAMESFLAASLAAR